MPLKTWEWGLIGMAIVIVIIINAIILWVLVTRTRKLQKEGAESETIKDAESTNSRLEDEGTIITTVQEIKIEQGELYGNNYASVTPAQTVLSPPPPSKQHTLETLPEISTTTVASLVSERFLSLSPFRPYKTQSPQPPSTESSPSTLDSRQSASTPLQGSVNGSIWRGPTPPWTQYPGRSRF